MVYSDQSRVRREWLPLVLMVQDKTVTQELAEEQQRQGLAGTAQDEPLTIMAPQRMPPPNFLVSSQGFPLAKQTRSWAKRLADIGLSGTGCWERVEGEAGRANKGGGRVFLGRGDLTIQSSEGFSCYFPYNGIAY